MIARRIMAGGTGVRKRQIPGILAAAALLASFSSCARPRPQIAVIPNVPANQFAWQAPKHLPDGCAVVSPAAKGEPTDGETPGPVDLTPGRPDPRPQNWSVEFQIPDEHVKNFRGRIQPRTLKAGASLYRLIGSGANPAGDYWSNLPPPGTEQQWRTIYAVFSWWNGASCVERYVVPRHHELKVWEGTAGPQKDEGRSGYYLVGGGWQYWIPGSMSQIDSSQIQYAHAPWRR